MRIKQLLHEDFVNYKKPSMFIGTSYCTGKCYKELGLSCTICQNDALQKLEILDMSSARLTSMYINNPITQAIVFGGLEPFDQFDELYDFIEELRNSWKCNDDVVIYTGYNKNEIEKQVTLLKDFSNIIIKFGRYIPGQKPHFDEVLGVNLASNNQYAERIS